VTFRLIIQNSFPLTCIICSRTNPYALNSVRDVMKPHTVTMFVIVLENVIPYRVTQNSQWRSFAFY
jgi:hypothetical protein